MNYVAPWWLPEGNAQTIWAALRARRYLGPAPQFCRERWTAPDGDFVDVDWLQSPKPLPLDQHQRMSPAKGVRCVCM